MNPSSPPNPDVCQRCSALGRTCCSISGPDEEFCFPISPAEMSAIQAAGHGADCFASAPNTEAFVKQLGHLMPGRQVENVFHIEGTHWRLMTTSQGDCVFLGTEGCSLPRPVRPYYCKIFPLWVFRGRLTWFTAEECLAQAECHNLAAMLGVMNTDHDEIRTLFSQMCGALGLEKQTR